MVPAGFMISVTSWVAHGFFSRSCFSFSFAAVQSEPGLLSKTHPAEKGAMPSSSAFAMGVGTGARAAVRVRRSQTGWLRTANLGIGARREVDRVLVERLLASKCGRVQAGVRHFRLLRQAKRLLFARSHRSHAHSALDHLGDILGIEFRVSDVMLDHEERHGGCLHTRTGTPRVKRMSGARALGRQRTSPVRAWLIAVSNFSTLAEARTLHGLHATPFSKEMRGMSSVPNASCPRLVLNA